MSLWMRLLFVSYVLAVYFTAMGEAWSRRYRRNKYIERYSASELYGFDVPVLRMLKRQVNRFQYGANARLTLVFRTSEPVIIRWFKRAPKFNMRTSEVPNMLPVDGHPQYHVKYVTSHDVKATSLIITNFNMTFPQDFETIITNTNGTLQFQISTMIKESTFFVRRPVYSPEWVIMPPATYKFHNNDHLKVHCRIFVPNDVSTEVTQEGSEMYVNELTLNHATKHINEKKARMVFESVLSAHRDSRRHNSTDDNIQVKRKHGSYHIKTLKSGHALYDVKMINQNATVQNAEGIYQCAMDRRQDKLYVLSDITAVGWKSSLPNQYRAEILPCNGKGKHEFFRTSNIPPRLRFSRNEAACFRCRGMGYPHPEVGIFDMSSRELSTSPGLGVTKYINVKDGGMPEVTVTLHNVASLPRGRYVCKVYSNHINTKSHSQKFNIYYY